MTIDEIQSALKFDMDMMLFDAMTGETDSKESLKTGNEMNYIHYCANEEAIELLEELKAMRNLDKSNFSGGYNKAIDDFVEKVKLKYLGVHPDELYEKYYPYEICKQIKEIAEQLKVGDRE